MNAPHCSIALVRPPETSLFAPGAERWRKPFSEEVPDAGEAAYCPFLDAWMDAFRERIATIAEEEGVTAIIDEYQWHDPNKSPGRARRRAICQSDVLTMVDPTWDGWALLAGYLNGSPHRRGLVGFSSLEDFDDSLLPLSGMKVPCCTKVISEKIVGEIITRTQKCSWGSIQRCFPFLRDNEDRMRAAVRNALIYPEGINAVPDSHLHCI